jgi:tetratricopeptide (TPR) repeat protein
MPDLYTSCPCGSGKKFKWCCQPIHEQISRAFEQDAAGQHDTALRIMDEVVAANPGNPEAWGRKAQLLYQSERVDEAEAALQKAFDLNPRYPFGHYLRGRFRHFEGELPGALMLFRKAAELYDPEAKGILAQICALIAECELKLNRPVAARAALELAMKLESANDDYRNGFEQIFGKESRLPTAAKEAYSFQGVAAMAPAERRTAWKNALGTATTGKLADAGRAFAQLAAEDEADAAAWYNLGLVRAWLGDNAAALEALDRYVALEPDEGRAAAAWALGEVLRCGQGLEDQADYVEHAAIFQIRDPEHFVALLGQMEKERTMVGAQVFQEEGVLRALLLEKPTALTPELAATQPARMAASLMIIGGILRLWHVNREALDRAVQLVRQRAGPMLSEPHWQRAPAAFGEVLSEAVVFPIGVKDQQEGERRIAEGLARFFEEVWIHRPLRSLNSIPPVDAAGHGTLRKKLLGVVQFLEDIARGNQSPYDFDRLRRKLGLLEPAPAVAAPAAAGPDIAAMGAPELAGLALEMLSDQQLEQAYQAAQKLDANDLASRFLKALVARPAQPERPDRYPWYKELIQMAQKAGDTDAALDLINEGMKADCEHNEGRRRNDYELRRGQLHAKRGETDAAQDVFDRLIERVPSELRYRGSAAEAMLSAKQGARALRFAEEGLARARQQNQRDSEDYFKELVAAARKQGG